MGTNEQIDLAKKPGEISTKLHKFYKGKIETPIICQSINPAIKLNHIDA